MVYPLKLRPFFRHGAQTPWGGQALAQLFSKPIPDALTGESLEISAIPGMESIVENGALSGRTLKDAVDGWGSALTGTQAPGFPLLVKLLDARERLSVQVHPGNAYAFQNEGGKLGKTEAWLVLSAPKDVRLVYGLDTGDRTLLDYVQKGELEVALHWISVKQGDVLYIPSGLVHALGGGDGGDLVVYEIQQSSDVTYRFWDWGRLDKEGRPRALHMEKALDVADAHLRPDKPAGVKAPVPGGAITYYIANDYFELSLAEVAGEMPLPSGRMLLLTALGSARLTWPDGEIGLAAGDSAVVPAAFSGAALIGDTRVIISATPDQAALRMRLGAGARAVAGLMDERSNA